MRSGMTWHLLALCVDANDPFRLARVWAGVLGWEIDTGFRIRFLAAKEQGMTAINAAASVVISGRTAPRGRSGSRPG